MTAKEKLRERIEAMGEEEASEALRLLDLRSDPERQDRRGGAQYAMWRYRPPS